MVALVAHQFSPCKLSQMVKVFLNKADICIQLALLGIESRKVSTAH